MNFDSIKHTTDLKRESIETLEDFQMKLRENDGDVKLIKAIAVALAAIEPRIPRVPAVMRYGYNGESGKAYICTTCGEIVDHSNFCRYCGQMIEWRPYETDLRT